LRGYYQELFSPKELATGGFVILILITCVFTFIMGCGGEGATSSGQATPLVPSPDVITDQPTIIDVALIDTSRAWATDRIGKELYRIDNGAPVQKRAPEFGGKTYLSFVNQRTGFAFDQVGFCCTRKMVEKAGTVRQRQPTSLFTG
jgi:hypothetical protein